MLPIACRSCCHDLDILNYIGTDLIASTCLTNHYITTRLIEHFETLGGQWCLASANPGCSLHLAAAGLDVRHPLELIDQALAAARLSRRPQSRSG